MVLQIIKQIDPIDFDYFNDAEYFIDKVRNNMKVKEFNDIMDSMFEESVDEETVNDFVLRNKYIICRRLEIPFYKCHVVDFESTTHGEFCVSFAEEDTGWDGCIELMFVVTNDGVLHNFWYRNISNGLLTYTMDKYQLSIQNHEGILEQCTEQAFHYLANLGKVRKINAQEYSCIKEV